MICNRISKYRCGSPHAATIVGVEGEAKGKSWQFQSSIPIGRGMQNTFCFPDDETLAEQHTGIVHQSGRGWCVINSNPEAPTYIDDQRVEARFTVIPSGSIVRCGQQAFQVVYVEPGQSYQGSAAQRLQLEGESKASERVRRELQALLNRTKTG